MKKAAITMSVLSLVAALGFAGCSCNNDKKTTPINVNAKDIYAISALSSVNYLDSIPTTTGVGLTTIANEHLSTIFDCLKMFDGVLTSGGLSQEVIKNESTDPELKDYNFVMQISIPGHKDILDMYYDELETETETEIEDETEEIETSTTLKGVIVIDGKQYKMDGKREFETEGDESEASIEFTTYSSTNKNNKIIINQEIENDEVEFEYSFYKDFNGKSILVEQTEIEIENEDGNVELELELENTNKGLVTCSINKKDDNSFNLVYINSGQKLTAIATRNADNDYTISYNK